MRGSPLLLLALLALALALAPGRAAAASPSSYTSRFDNVDLKSILSSRRLVTAYSDCLLGRKACTPEGSELKRVLPEALSTRCAKCTPRQQEAALYTIRVLRQRYPDVWGQLQRRWDPTGKLTQALDQEERRRGAAG